MKDMDRQAAAEDEHPQRLYLTSATEMGEDGSNKGLNRGECGVFTIDGKHKERIRTEDETSMTCYDWK